MFGNYNELVILTGATFATEYQISSGVTTGRKYRFKIQASNAVGWNTASTYLEMMPATVPGAPF